MSKTQITSLFTFFIVWPLLIFIPPYVIQDLWLWFVMPLMAGLQPLSFWQAFGLIIFLGYFNKPFFEKEVTDYINRDLSVDDKVALSLKRGMEGVFFALIMWGFGALVAFGV
jgi:hypothetical protein